MREYELTFIVQPEISEEGSARILGKLDELLEGGASRRLLLDDQGKRKLAYPIEKFQKGHYYMLSFLDDGKVVSDLERTLRLEESVLRFLSVRTEDDVTDVEARVAAAREREAELKKRAAEKAAREAEEAKVRAEAEAEREAAAAESDDSDADDEDDSDDDAVEADDNSDDDEDEE